MTTSLRITSFNVGLLDVYFCKFKLFEFSPFTRVRAKALPDLLAKHETDIFCLQELYHPSDYAFIRNTLQEAFPYSFRKLSFQSSRLGSGLAIFSRFPLLDCNEQKFNTQAFDEGFFSMKSYQSVLIDSGHQFPFRLVNTHTTAGGIWSHPESKRADEIREGQLFELANAIKSDKNHSTVVAGDLNCGPETSKANFDYLVSYGALIDFQPKEKSKHAELTNPVSWSCENPLNRNGPHRSSPSQRIDHILITSDLGLHAYLDRKIVFTEPTIMLTDGSRIPISDHFGVQATLQIN
jgi:endonuclease/exonuclease/phosphatase family metal-dependent hydrolase